VEPGGRDWLEDRIRGCLAFAALGDVAGEPVEGCSREEVARYGDPLRQLRADLLHPSGSLGGGGGVTDDTGQLEALVRALVESGGRLTAAAWREALVAWFEESPTAERAGPTSRAMLAGSATGDERIGVTNGSAMRAAPCGLVHPGDPEAAVRLAWRAPSPRARPPRCGRAPGWRR
jgi:ADP-ribosylglycohydrolase